MKKRFFCYILTASILCSGIGALAESETEATTDIVVNLTPDNYASIYLQKGASKTEAGGYNGTTRAMNMYYNTLYSENDYIYMHSGTILSEYFVPLKELLSEMDITHYVGTFPSNAQNNGSHPIFYNLGAFSDGLDIKTGKYSGPSEYNGNDGTSEYETIKAITLNYWPVSSTTSVGYSKTNWASQVAASFKGSSETKGSRTKKVADTAVKAFKDDISTDVITFATGRSTSGYAKSAYSLNSEEKIPYLTVTYAKEELLNSLNSATEADMSEITDGLSLIGSLSEMTNMYDEYSSLVNRSKKYVADQLYKAVQSGGYSDLTEFYTAYDEAVAYATENGVLVAINEASSADDINSIIDEMGVSGLIDENAQASYDKYSKLNLKMKNIICTELYNIVLTDGFADLESFYVAFDKAFFALTEIQTVIQPENYATIHITKDGYKDHIKYAKKLAAYYNTPYTGVTYAEFGSLISGYTVPFKNSVKDIQIRYYVKAGGMQEGRTIPVFYDLNMFSVEAEKGSYLGPVEATDTTEATEATQTYKDILAYTENYWPTSGYSYSSSPFASQLAFKILETTSGTKTYDVTSVVLNKLKESESDCVTFATGRETSEYANGSFDATTEERLPKLHMTYDAVSVLDKINTTAENGVVKLIDDLGKAGLLETSENGYKAFSELSTRSKAVVAENIYSILSADGYSTFDEFISSYDEAVTTSETVIQKLVISDGDKVYDTAMDAKGRNVTVKVPVKFAEKSGSFKVVLAVYEGKELSGVKIADMLPTETEKEFNISLSDDVTLLKAMVFDNLSDIRPISKAVNDRYRMLDGKKVIFIGNSHTYRGMTVIEKELDVLDQQSRSNDTGYFYQLCKENGCDVEVTNWAFSGHGLQHIFGGNPCTYNSSCNGKVHESYLTDRYFDYVFMNSARGAISEETFLKDVEYIMNFFRQANPDVKFVLLGTASTQGINQLGDVPSPTVLSEYKNLEKEGVIIADWGEVVAGVIKGKYTVPGATKQYSRNSFIVSDGYHANALTGYITTLTAFCALTGEKAVGQPYYFYNDTSRNSKFNMLNYINKYYTNGTSDTNFHEIFESESDMKGIQQLVDDCLENKPYRQYEYSDQ